MARQVRKTERKAQGEQGVLVRDTIARHFLHLTRDTKDKKPWLTRLANENPSAYVALVTKTVPQQARLDVAVEHTVDLGQAMLEASQRLAAAQATLNLIDITPATSDLSPATPAMPATSDAAPATSDVEPDTSDVEPDASDV